MMYPNKDYINIGGETTMLFISFFGIIYITALLKEAIKIKDMARILFCSFGLFILVAGFIVAAIGVYQFYMF